MNEEDLAEAVRVVEGLPHHTTATQTAVAVPAEANEIPETVDAIVDEGERLGSAGDGRQPLPPALQ